MKMTEINHEGKKKKKQKPGFFSRWLRCTCNKDEDEPVVKKDDPKRKNEKKKRKKLTKKEQ